MRSFLVPSSGLHRNASGALFLMRVMFGALAVNIFTLRYYEINIFIYVSVTLWEVYSKGEDPYNAMAGQDVIDFVIEGRRLPKPKLCPDEIYQIMLQCWQRSTKTRPTFMQLVRYFKHMGQENRDSLKNIWPEFSLYWTQ